jgi:hypothetical protein
MAKPKGYSLTAVAKKVGVTSATIIRRIKFRKVKITLKKDAKNQYIFTESDLRKLKEHNDGIF